MNKRIINLMALGGLLMVPMQASAECEGNDAHLLDRDDQQEYDRLFIRPRLQSQTDLVVARTVTEMDDE